jgi:transmembrane 9 superfamily protein 2/4
MEKMGGRISATLILAFLFISSAHSFYLPGVAPRDFQKVRLSAFLFLIH